MPRARSSLPPAVLLCLLTAATARFHPQDGPDANVRMSIGPGAVTLDIAVNLAFCDAVVDTGREDPWALPDEERPWVTETLIDWYREHVVVKVGGERLALTRSTALDLPPPDLSLLPLFPITRTKGIIDVGVELTYEFDGEPKHVELEWPAFPDSTIPGLGPIEVSIQLVALGIASIHTVTKEEPGFAWHAPAGGAASHFLAVPESAPPAAVTVLRPLPFAVGLAWLVLVVAAALRRRRRGLVVAFAVLPLLAVVGWTFRDAGAFTIAGGELPPPTEDEALAIFEPLHRNIYRAFDYTRESDVYDALAGSVDGALLESLYDEVYQSLIMREEGGALSRVEAVHYLEHEVIDVAARGFAVRVRWQVDGAVFHWGHAHHRTNEHTAEYTVVRTTGGWRIAGTRMIEQQRVSSTPGSGN